MKPGPKPRVDADSVAMDYAIRMMPVGTVARLHSISERHVWRCLRRALAQAEPDVAGVFEHALSLRRRPGIPRSLRRRITSMG